MKQFDELDKREKQSKSRIEIKNYLTKKNIVIVCVCVLSALILALIWTKIYVSFQTRRLEEWQSENRLSTNNIMFTWDVDNVTTTSETSTNSNETTSSYKDLIVEFVGAEKTDPSSNYLQVYLKINNPNTETVNICTTGIYLNGVCVEDGKYLDNIVGGKETIIKVTVQYSSITANQVGNEIHEVLIQYNYENESNDIREYKDSGFSYRIGDVAVDREKDVNEFSKKEERKEIYGILSNNNFEKMKIKYIGMESTNTDIVLKFLVENESSIDYDIKFWYESDINGYTLKMKSTSELSGDVIPANGSALLMLKYEKSELQYCGITRIDEVCFLIANDEAEKENAVEVSFEELKLDIHVTEITENSIANRIDGILSEGNMSDNINISYVGYSTAGTYICLNFIVENVSSEYYGFAFWYASQVNKCALKMKSTSEVSGELDGNDKVLLSIKYDLEDLIDAEIDSIEEVSFSFANSLDSKEDASTAQFSGLNIPVSR